MFVIRKDKFLRGIVKFKSCHCQIKKTIFIADVSGLALPAVLHDKMQFQSLFFVNLTRITQTRENKQLNIFLITMAHVS